MNKIFKLFPALIILFNLAIAKIFCSMSLSGNNYELTSNVLETTGGEIESLNHILNNSIGQTVSQVSVGEKFTASLGFIYTVNTDTVSPVSNLIIGTPKFYENQQVYVNSDTPFYIQAEDPVVYGVTSGVKESRWQIARMNDGVGQADGSPRSSESGAGGWQMYTESFKITGNDGSYTVEYYSIDNVNNIEVTKSVIVHLDNTAPATEISLSNPKYDFENNIWISSETIVSLTAADVGEVSCGVKYTEYKIDDEFYSIYNSFATGEPTWPLPTSGLSEGEHTIYYRSYDNLLNCETEKSLKVIIDNSEPETYVLATEPKYNDYVTSESTFSFVAVDSGTIPSGIKETKYRINPPEPEEFGNYVSIFNITGTDGIYTVKYYSTDNVDNVESVRDLTVKLDNAKPASKWEVGSGEWEVVDGKNYITPESEVVLSAEDPFINSVAAGVKEIKYSIDNSAFSIYNSSFVLTEGIHTVKYYSVDQLNNTELTNSITLYADGTAPVTEINIGEPKYEAFGNTVISPLTPLTLTAVDPMVANVASQVKRTEYRIAGGNFVTYTGTFTLTEGIHTIEYRSIDNVHNTEELKSITVTVTYISEYAAFSEEGVTISGQGKIYGNTRSNDDVTLSGQALLDGNAEGKTVVLTGQSEITGTITQNAPAISTNAIDLEAIQNYVSQNNDNGTIPETTKGKQPLINGVLSLSGQDSLTISAGTYYLAGINLSGQTKLYFTGQIRIFCTGKIEVSGQSELHHSGSPYDLIIYCGSGQPVSISGQGEMQSIVYAPYSDVSVTGQGITLSNVFAKVITVSGQGKLVGVGYSSGTVSASPKLFSTPQADPTFVLGEVYSYPNPAKRGACPTLHIECGLADSIEIRIYNIAAELVDSTELYGTPSVVSGKYAYEYAWDISDIASGVYIYVIRANKNGFGTIKATGKAAIIK